MEQKPDVVEASGGGVYTHLFEELDVKTTSGIHEDKVGGKQVQMGTLATIKDRVC